MEYFGCTRICFTKKIAHGFRDLINQFDSLNAWLDFKKFNPHSLICGFIGFLLTLLLCINLWMIRSVMSYEFKIVSIVFFTIPFIGLAAVSFLHGFNYTLYSSHTVEYAMLLSLPVCHSLFLLKKTYHITTILLSGICFATPLASSFGSLISPALTKNNFQVSETEEERGFAARDFSAAIKLIEGTLNIILIYFFPTIWRSRRFVLTNKTSYFGFISQEETYRKLAFLTSKPLIVYCAYSVYLEKTKNSKKH